MIGGCCAEFESDRELKLWGGDQLRENGTVFSE